MIFSAGAILTALAQSLWPFVACRILVGIAIGASSVVAPMYTTELAPPERRGQMVFLFQFFVTAGILTAYVVDLIFADIGLSWRWMFGVAVIPGLALVTGELAANLLVTITFLTLINGIGPSATFWIYAFFALLCLLFVWRAIPETKARPLEKIEQYWRSGRQWEAAEQLAGGQSGGAARSDKQTGSTTRQARTRDDTPPGMPHALT